MNLQNYLNSLAGKGLLKPEKIGLDQVKALLAGASRNLAAAKKNLAIDEETAYVMAYAAMLKIARALIFLWGFRPDDGGQHKTTVEVAGKILGESFNDLINKFDQMRRKRNELSYDPLVPLSQIETENALKNAEEFFKKVKDFLIKTDPQKKLFD